MISSEEITVLPHDTSFISDSVRAFSIKNKGDRPADIVFKVHEKEIIEHGFAELRFDSNIGSLVPKIEVVKWSKFFIVMGVRRWVFFENDACEIHTALDLYRRDIDDTGYYQVVFEICDKRLLGIYEGGVVGILPDVGVAWHRQKKWDDFFHGVEDGAAIFLMEDGNCYAIDCVTGNDAVFNDRTAS